MWVIPIDLRYVILNFANYSDSLRGPKAPNSPRALAHSYATHPPQMTARMLLPRAVCENVARLTKTRRYLCHMLQMSMLGRLKTSWFAVKS